MGDHGGLMGTWRNHWEGECLWAWSLCFIVKGKNPITATSREGRRTIYNLGISRLEIRCSQFFIAWLWITCRPRSTQNVSHHLFQVINLEKSFNVHDFMWAWLQNHDQEAADERSNPKIRTDLFGRYRYSPASARDKPHYISWHFHDCWQAHFLGWSAHNR